MIEQVNIPEGASGLWKVQRFTVSEDESKLDALRSAFRGGRYVRPGSYTRLSRNGVTVMSDTPDEMRDHFYAVCRARDHVLINGLGLGMVLKAVLAKPEVTRVTVVERSEDVIALVAPHYSDPRLTIVCADAYEYKPPKGERYGAVWHDIWDYITSDNLAGMTRLKHKYGRRADWQGCWAEEICRYHKRKGRQAMANTGRLAQPAPELQDLSPLNKYIGAQSGRWTFCGLDLAGGPDTCVVAECERDENGKPRIVSVDFGPIESRLAALLAKEGKP